MRNYPVLFFFDTEKEEKVFFAIRDILLPSDTGGLSSFFSPPDDEGGDGGGGRFAALDTLLRLRVLVASLGDIGMVGAFFDLALLGGTNLLVVPYGVDMGEGSLEPASPVALPLLPGLPNIVSISLSTSSNDLVPYK